MSFTTHLSSPNASISSAVKAFTNPINNVAQAGQLEDELWKSWKELLNHVAVTPHASQMLLVDFIKALRKEECPKKEDGELYEIWGSSFEWKDLPLFGAEIREQWNVEPEAKSPQADQQSWVNKNAFLAQLTSISQPNDPMDYSLYAVWAFREVFEDIDLVTDLPADFLLETVAVWFLYAGDVLKKRSETGQDYDGKTAREGNALGPKGWKGLNSERWGIWKEKLGVAQEKVKSEGTKKLLKEASKAL